MPVREGRARKGLPEEKDLCDRLIAELRNPQMTGEPDIIIERPSRGTVHIFVIWADWGELEQMVRSRVILDAYEEVYGIDEVRTVTVAMGLTPNESKRLGVA